MADELAAPVLVRVRRSRMLRDMRLLVWSLLALLVAVVVLVVFRHAIRNFFGSAIRQARVPVALPAELVLTANDGSPWPLASRRGRVLLLANTASKCGFTRQYDGMEALWQRYHERGLDVVAIPTNDFLGQEPGSDEQIAEFCRLQYGVSFPLMAKTTIRGPQVDPFLRWVQEESPLPGMIGWNFEKFLVDRQGRLRARISTRVKPEDPRLVALIEQLLAEEPPADLAQAPEP